MAHPSDLVPHYSSMAFQTRIYALTAVGAVLASTINWIKSPADSNFVGALLILVVASLGEINRRFTYAFICACYAASRCRRSDSPEGKAQAAAWKRFRIANDRPWKAYVGRIILSWSTYAPGIVVGVYLIMRDGRPTVVGWIGLVLSVLVVLWWVLAPTVRAPLMRKPRPRSLRAAPIALQPPT